MNNLMKRGNLFRRIIAFISFPIFMAIAVWESLTYKRVTLTLWQAFCCDVKFQINCWFHEVTGKFNRFLIH